MSFRHSFQSLLLLCGAAALSACTQGDDIASPGPTNPGTPPGGGGGGGGGGGAGADTCPSGFAAGTSVAGLTVCNITGTILGSLTLPLKDDNGDGLSVVYRLNGRVDVGVDRGAAGTGGTAGTLTIAPGVTVFGNSGADYMVVNRGSRLVADGTSGRPILFTSQNDLVRQGDDAGFTANSPAAFANIDGNDDGDSAIGEWGGLVLLGRAPINRCFGGGTPGTNSCQNTIEGVTAPEAQYGGDFANDDSGILRYVQVRFAGFALSSGNELNGITFGGTGRGTVVDFVQVHNNSDDGIEMFGGTTDLKHIVLTGNDDDSLDTDNGWQGRVQFLVVKQRDDGGDNGFEMSSSGAAGAALPTNPVIANFTSISSRTQGLRINTGHVGRFINGIVVHRPTTPSPCIRWETSAGDGVAGYGGVGVDPTFNSVKFDCGAAALATGDTVSANASFAADANNVQSANTLSAMFFPGLSEQAVNEFDLASLPGTFFVDTDYIGAFAPAESPTNNWATGWTIGLFAPPPALRARRRPARRTGSRCARSAVRSPSTGR